MSDIERWTITPAHQTKDVEGNTFGRTTRVEPRLEYGGESFEVMRADAYEGVVEEAERLRGRVVTDGLNDKVRVIDVYVPAGYEAVIRPAGGR